MDPQSEQTVPKAAGRGAAGSRKTGYRIQHVLGRPDRGPGRIGHGPDRQRTGHVPRGQLESHRLAAGAAHGLRTAMTSAVVEDREGSLWIAMSGGGVARWLGYGEWEAWTKEQGLPSDLIWSIRRDRKGALWVGTSLGLARLDGRGPPRTWTRKDGLGGDNVRWLGETADGAVWAVVKPGSVARIDPATGKIRLFGQKDGLACQTSHRGFIDHLDRLWVATACGVFRNDLPSASGRFRRIDQPASLEHGAWAFSEDKQGPCGSQSENPCDRAAVREERWWGKPKFWPPAPLRQRSLRSNRHCHGAAKYADII